MSPVRTPLLSPREAAHVSDAVADAVLQIFTARISKPVANRKLDQLWCDVQEAVNEVIERA